MVNFYNWVITFSLINVLLNKYAAFILILVKIV